MSLSAKFEPFVRGAPCAVITRIVAGVLLDEDAVNTLFCQHATTQYDRQITLHDLVNVMLDVATGAHRAPRSAFLARADEIAASLTAFYGKLNRTEPAIARALVEHTADRARQLILAWNVPADEPVPGFRSFIIDGNVLTGTEHRLKPLRKTRAAALPGQALAVYECATSLVAQTVLWEDAHSQERALLPELAIEPGTHLVADRNFCVKHFLCRIETAGACFTVRHHRSTLPLDSLEMLGKQRCCGRCASGEVFEQRIRVSHAGQSLTWRLITLRLDTPTRDGDVEIRLISNLPADVRAAVIAMAYKERWTIEGYFQKLTQWLHCEVPTLSQPRAALFAFAMSLVAGNLLAVVLAAIRAVHGGDAVENVSYCALVDEVGGPWRGMLLALPPEEWFWIERGALGEAAAVILEVAPHIRVDRMRKTRRGPKKPRRTPNCTRIKHVSTFKVLKQQRENTC